MTRSDAAAELAPDAWVRRGAALYTVQPFTAYVTLAQRQERLLLLSSGADALLLCRECVTVLPWRSAAPGRNSVAGSFSRAFAAGHAWSTWTPTAADAQHYDTPG